MRSTLTLLLLIISVNTFSQIGIGTTTPEGALDITSTNSGVLVPRVALTSRLTSAPVTNPQTGAIVAGTLIWNTASTGTPPNNVTPGFYYWNGSAWIAITGNTGREWALRG
nr:hypothetical protein [Flavobacterium sp.]